MNAQVSSCPLVGGTPTLARQSVERLSSRLENEKRELVLFLIELAGFDAKKLALELGYPSTLGCLVSELRLSESSVLDDSNVDELLEGAAGLSEPEVRPLVWRVRLGEPPMVAQLAPATPAAATAAADPVATAIPAASTKTLSVAPREDLQALTLWVGRELREELEAVRTLLGHAVPGGKGRRAASRSSRAAQSALARSIR
jgi:hypothetical protein